MDDGVGRHFGLSSAGVPFQVDQGWKESSLVISEVSVGFLPVKTSGGE